MPKAKKLPSGNWRVLGYYKDATGKIHRPSFTAPTRREAEFLERSWAATMKAAPKEARISQTVADVVDKYIELSGPALSPTTLYRYETMRKHGFKELLAMPVEDLTEDVLQKAVNKEALRTYRGKRLAPKTVSNEWSLLSAALKFVTGKTYHVKLPKLQPGNYIELPDPADVMEALKGTDIELPAMLALWLSFTMSEVLGLRASDVHKDLIYINGARVYLGGRIIEKNTAKNSTRKRLHKIPPYLLELINNTEAVKKYAETGEDGPLVTMTDYNIRYRLEKYLDKAGIHGFTFHKLRYLNASVMHALNVPDKYAQERGGWKTGHIMKTVYMHTLSEERQKVDALVDTYFEQKLHTNTAHDPA